MAKKDYDSMGPWSAGQERFGKWLIKRVGKYQVKVYELTNGRIWNRFLGAPCAILTTTGKKTGLKRKTPLLYLRDGNNVVMVASQGGFSTEPFWYKNICANPEVTVQIGAEKRTMIARHAADEEKERLWPMLDDVYEGFKEYRARTRGVRVIPIVIFSEQ